MILKMLKYLLYLFLLFCVLIKIDNAKSINDIKRLNRIEIYDKDNKLIYSSINSHEGNYIEINNIRKKIKDIFIYLEDKRFYTHSGFDIYRISSSILKGSKSGASTITQQLIKNIYFTNERSLKRKIKEFYLSNRLERIYSKDEILECYFNTLYFNHNIYGIADASHFYFKKELNDLTVSEIVILSNIIKNPNLYSPINNYTLSLQKRNSTLKILYSGGVISKSEMLMAQNEKPLIYGLNKPIYDSNLLYFKDVVFKELKDVKIKSDFNQVISIYTNYDQFLNKKISHFLSSYNFNSDMSSLVVDKDGYYVSIVGNKDYKKSSFNIALNGNRQIASTVKAMLYYEALKKGYPTTFEIKSEKTKFKINGETYSFSNFANVYENKPISMAYAAATSDNVYALKMHVLLRLEGIYKHLYKHNILTTPSITQAIGDVNLSLNDLVNIYYSYQSLGYKCNFKAIKSIYINDKLYKKNYQDKKVILNSNVCFVLNDLLTYMFDKNISSMAKVTGYTISDSLIARCAGKSGLDDYNSYMIGYNPYYTIGVWSGYNDMTPLNNYNDKVLPKMLFKEIFNTLMQEKKDIWYKCPENIYVKYECPSNLNKNYKRNIYYLY